MVCCGERKGREHVVFGLGNSAGEPLNEGQSVEDDQVEKIEQPVLYALRPTAEDRVLFQNRKVPFHAVLLVCAVWSRLSANSSTPHGSIVGRDFGISHS